MWASSRAHRPPTRCPTLALPPPVMTAVEMGGVLGIRIPIFSTQKNPHSSVAEKEESLKKYSGQELYYLGLKRCNIVN